MRLQFAREAAPWPSGKSQLLTPPTRTPARVIRDRAADQPVTRRAALEVARALLILWDGQTSPSMLLLVALLLHVGARQALDPGVLWSIWGGWTVMKWRDSRLIKVDSDLGLMSRA